MPPARPPKPRRAASANAASNYTGKEGIQALALRGMMGVDLTAIPTIGPGTALVIASEIGPDFSAFPSAHFCSWLALAPGTRISGGKNLPGKSPKAVNPVGQALRKAAMAARRSETFIGAKHRARFARMDTPVAIKATARELACLIYLMVTKARNTSSHRRLREAAPQESSLISTASPKTRAPTRPGTAKRRNAKLNAVNCLGNCYSRASNFDPPESSLLNRLQCRSAPNPRAEQQAGPGASVPKGGSAARTRARSAERSRCSSGRRRPASAATRRATSSNWRSSPGRARLKSCRARAAPSGA